MSLVYLCSVRDKYGDVAVGQLESESESSSSEEEDDEAEALTPQVEREFLRTLSLIKSKDPRIYNNDIMFFSKGMYACSVSEAVFGKGSSIPLSHTDTVAPIGDKGKEKPMYLKDYERKRLLERGR